MLLSGISCQNLEVSSFVACKNYNIIYNANFLLIVCKQFYSIHEYSGCVERNYAEFTDYSIVRIIFRTFLFDILDNCSEI